jgi:site-specific recombinase XerD
MSRFLALRKAQGAAPRTLRGYEESIKSFFTRYPTAWSPACRDCLLEYLAQDGTSPATYNVRLKVLHPFFRFCVDQGIFDESPAEGLKYRRQEPRIVDHNTDDIRKVLSSMREDTFTGLRDKTLFLLSLDSGIRPSEALQLLPSDIDLSACRVRIRAATSKTRTGRTVFFSDHVRHLLERLLAVRPEEWNEGKAPVFCSSYGTPMDTHTWTVQLRRYAQKAGLPRLSAYDLRHQHAIDYLRNGGDVMTLQKEMGHSTLDMTRQYLALSDDDLRTAHRKASPINALFQKEESRKRMGRLKGE